MPLSLLTVPSAVVQVTLLTIHMLWSAEVLAILLRETMRRLLAEHTTRLSPTMPLLGVVPVTQPVAITPRSLAAPTTWPLAVIVLPPAMVLRPTIAPRSCGPIRRWRV